MVVLKGVNDHEIPSMVSFCRQIGADLKLLDLIVDIGEFTQDIADYARRHYDNLIDVMADFEAKGAIRSTSFSPGGLGHPMPTFRIEDGPPIQVKTARLGAWYGDICRSCRHFPCHDALMALRLTPAGMLQRCLLRSDNLIDLLTPLRTGVPDHAIQERIDDAIATYRSARFYEFDEIARIRTEEAYRGTLSGNALP
jgi:GTP 3',8-cyclase